MRNNQPYHRHASADRQIASAIRVIKAVLELDIYPDHREELLSWALWKITEAEGGGKRGKYRLRFCSQAALAAAQDLRHDHVFERKKMVRELLAHPREVETIVAKAVGCVVTKDEHRLLNRVPKHIDGWKRYTHTKIVVVDTTIGKPLDCANLM